MKEQRHENPRIDDALRAAESVFAEHGFRRASMAKIAAAAGVSRPALYQWFDNREDMFRSVMERMLEASSRAAIAALESSDDPADALAGWLRGRYADGYERMSTTPHGAELLDAHLEHSVDVAQAADRRMHEALAGYLRRLPGATSESIDSAIQLLTLSPMGLKADQPTPAVYGQRLDQLAAAVAALLDPGQRES